MPKANDASTSLAQAASSIGKAAGRAASSISSKAGEVADGAKAAMGNVKIAIDDAADERAAKKIAEYEPDIVAAEAQLVGTAAESFIMALGEPPLPRTAKTASSIHSTFPVPKEQAILWADAEFDLRPSGIVATEKGLFIKSNAALFARKSKDSESVDPKQSRLAYFPWDNFEPAWFIAGDDTNLAFSVEMGCSAQFVQTCRLVTRAEKELPQARISAIARGLDVTDSPMKLAAIESAAVMSAERAVFTEQKAFVNNPGGHGEMAEEAITMIDNALGHKARVVGRNNAKDGADRIVDGMLIQTKYHSSARGSLESAFSHETGEYRYMTEDGTPMQLEVAKEQYEQVLFGFKRKIEQGKVPGVTDPDQAESIVRKGRLTKLQAVNLAKAGTVESLKYDVATGAVICTCAFGISFITAAFNCYRKTGDRDMATKAGIAAGVQVFGISFVQHLLVSQLSRTGLAKTLLTPSQVVVEKLGSKSAQTLVNGLRALSGKSAISGAAASKQLAKILRSNAVTAAVTFAVFSVPETYRVVSGKMSGAQFTKNISSLAGSIACGFGGTIAAGAAAAKIAGMAGTAITPGIGTAVGAAGGFVGGVAGSAAVNAVGGVLHEGDGATFGRIFNALASCMTVEYLLDETEVTELIAILDSTPPDSLKKLMYSYFSADEQEEALRSFLNPIFEDIVSTRDEFRLPGDDEIKQALIELPDTEDTEQDD